MPKIGSQYYCRSTCAAREHRRAYVPGRGYPVSVSAYRAHRLTNSVLSRDTNTPSISQITAPISQPHNAKFSPSQHQDSQPIQHDLTVEEDKYSESGASTSFVTSNMDRVQRDGSINDDTFVPGEVTEEEDEHLLSTTPLAYDGNDARAAPEELDSVEIFDTYDGESNSGGEYSNNDDDNDHYAMSDNSPQPDSEPYVIGDAVPSGKSHRHPVDPVISAEDAGHIRWLNFRLMHKIDNVGFSLLGKIPGITAKIMVPCINFFGTYAEKQSCPTCHEERCQPSGSSRKTFTYIPLRPRLHAIFGQVELARRLQEYPSEVMRKCSDEPGSVMDFWNGDLVKRLRLDGFFETRTEIALALSLDGVQLVKKGTHQVWPIMGIIMNLPPEMRYNKQNLLLFGAIPGPNMPRDIFSFLGPLLEEVKELSKTGMTVWNAAEGFYVNVKVHLCLVTGDQPAIAKLMCMKGHTGKRPCRFCLIKGQSAIEGGPNYFPLSQVKHVDSTGRPRLKARSNLRQDIEDVCQINQKSVFKKFGISGRSPLLDVPTLYWPESFPTDIMHLILQGVVPRTFEIWKGVRPSQYHAPENLFKDLAGLGHDIISCARDVPASLARSPLDIFKNFRGYRAENWFDFLQLFSHPLLDSRTTPDVRKNFVQLARIYSIASQEKITADDLRLLEDTSFNFVQSYEHIYSFDPTSRTSNLHGILHISDCIKNCGPAWVYWQFTIEKTCGNIVSWLSGKRHKDENLANLIVLNEKMNMLRWANPHLALTWEEKFFKHRPEITVGMLKTQVSAPLDFTERELDAIAKLIGYSSSYALELQGFETLEFRTYQANSEELVAGRKDCNRKGARCRRYVRCGKADENYFYAQVDCLFTTRMSLTDETYSLAMIREFVDLDYPSGQTDEDGYYGRVIPLRSRSLAESICVHVDDIQCTVGIVHNSFTAMDYILDRNWDIFDTHADEFDLAVNDGLEISTQS